MQSVKKNMHTLVEHTGGVVVFQFWSCGSMTPPLPVNPSDALLVNLRNKLL
jgi:hypothetical protein